MFNASTAGLPSEAICSVRYRFRSKFTASATMSTASACPLSRYSRATVSSVEFAVSEYTPGRSTSVRSYLPAEARPSLRSTVTPGQLPTVSRAPVNALNSVVLPQFGLPAIARRAPFLSVCSEGSAEPQPPHLPQQEVFVYAHPRACSVKPCASAPFFAIGSPVSRSRAAPSPLRSCMPGSTAMLRASSRRSESL